MKKRWMLYGAVVGIILSGVLFLLGNKNEIKTEAVPKFAGKEKSDYAIGAKKLQNNQRKAIPQGDLVSRHSSVVGKDTLVKRDDEILGGNQQKRAANRSNLPITTNTTENNNKTINNKVRVNPQYYLPSGLIPRGRSDLIALTTASVPIKEIIQKRQKLAEGKRLYERVIKKREASNELSNMVESKTVTPITKASPVGGSFAVVDRSLRAEKKLP